MAHRGIHQPRRWLSVAVAASVGLAAALLTGASTARADNGYSVFAFVGDNSSDVFPAGTSVLSAESNGGTNLTGTHGWFVQLNNPSPTSVNNPSITATSSLPINDFPQLSTNPPPIPCGPGQSPASPSAFPVSWSQSTLGMNGGGMGVMCLGPSNVPASYDPGFDTTDSVNPGTIASPNGTQTDTVTVTTQNPSYFQNNTLAQLNLSVSPTVPSQTVTGMTVTSNNVPVPPCTQPPSGGTCEQPQPNQIVVNDPGYQVTYTFTATLTDTNAENVPTSPNVQVGAIPHNQGDTSTTTSGTATSVSVADGVFDGSVSFASTDMGTWTGNLQNIFNVDYAGQGNGNGNGGGGGNNTPPSGLFDTRRDTVNLNQATDSTGAATPYGCGMNGANQELRAWTFDANNNSSNALSGAQISLDSSNPGVNLNASDPSSCSYSQLTSTCPAGHAEFCFNYGQNAGQFPGGENPCPAPSSDTSETCPNPGVPVGTSMPNNDLRVATSQDPQQGVPISTTMGYSSSRQVGAVQPNGDSATTITMTLASDPRYVSPTGCGSAMPPSCIDDTIGISTFNDNVDSSVPATLTANGSPVAHCPQPPGTACIQQLQTQSQMFGSATCNSVFLFLDQGQVGTTYALSFQENEASVGCPTGKPAIRMTAAPRSPMPPPTSTTCAGNGTTSLAVFDPLLGCATLSVDSSSSLSGFGTSESTEYVVQYMQQPFPTFTYAGIIGLKGIAISALSAVVDSWNSANGPYKSTESHMVNVLSNATATLGGAQVFGNVQSTQGSVVLQKGSLVTGNVMAGTTVTNSGGTIQGSTTTQHPTPPITPRAITACNAKSGYSSAAGISGKFTYSNGNLTVSGGSTAYLAGGAYCFASVMVSGGSQLVISASDSPVVINVTGTFNDSGGSVANMTGIPANLQIYSSYSGNAGVTLSGGSNAFLTMDAPYTGVTVSGGSPLYGALLGLTVSVTGNSSIHFDLALLSMWSTIFGT